MKQLKGSRTAENLLLNEGVLPASLGSTLVDVTTVPPTIVCVGEDAEKIFSLI